MVVMLEEVVVVVGSMFTDVRMPAEGRIRCRVLVPELESVVS